MTNFKPPTKRPTDDNWAIDERSRPSTRGVTRFLTRLILNRTTLDLARFTVPPAIFIFSVFFYPWETWSNDNIMLDFQRWMRKKAAKFWEMSEEDKEMALRALKKKSQS